MSISNEPDVTMTVRVQKMEVIAGADGAEVNAITAMSTAAMVQFLMTPEEPISLGTEFEVTITRKKVKGKLVVVPASVLP